jgi:hypothetical protein
MSKELYFKMVNNDIAFSGDIIRAHYLTTGTALDPDNHDEIRKIAASMSGIVRELNFPSPTVLVRSGHIVSAVRLYRAIHNCTLREANDTINKIAEQLKGGNNHV